MPSKGEQNVSCSSEELLWVKGARVGHPWLLPLMHSCAHHVPSRERGGYQTKKREGTVVLKGRE